MSDFSIFFPTARGLKGFSRSLNTAGYGSGSARQYPGLVRKVLPLFRAESRRMWQAGEGDPILLPLYHCIALGAGELLPLTRQTNAAVILKIQDRFEKEMKTPT